MSDQGDPHGWRHTLQEQLLDVFDRHGASVAVGLTQDGVAIRSQDMRVDAVNVLEVRALRENAGIEAGSLRTPKGDNYKLVIIAKRSLNLKAIPPQRRQEAELIVGKDNRVLKDRYGGRDSLTERELARVLANAETVVQI